MEQAITSKQKYPIINRITDQLRSINRIKLLIAIVAMIITFGSFAYADYDAYLAGTEKAGGMTPLIFKWIDDIAGTQTLETVKDKVAVNLNFAPDRLGSSGTGSEEIDIGGMTLKGVGTGVKQIHSVLVVAATAWAVITFLIGLEKQYFRNPHAPEILVKQFLLLGLSLILIESSLWLTQQLANFGSEMTGVIIDRLNTPSSDSNSVASQIDELKRQIYEECNAEGTGLKAISVGLTNMVNQLNYVLQLALPALITFVVSLIISFTCWSRAIEIIIRAALSPLSFADTLSDGGKSNAEKFIRNFLALSLQGMVIVIIMFFCGQITMSIMTSPGNFIIDKIPKIVTIGLVEVGLITKSLTMTKEIVGAV